MKTASITETKNQLSALLELVKQGETILITERNYPIARIEPALPENRKTEDSLLSLERKGIVFTRKPKMDRVSTAILTQKPPSIKASALGSLLEERERGR